VRGTIVPPAPTDVAPVLRKVPHVTAAFWAMKICATTLGETGGDLVSMTLGVGYATASLILIGAFAVTLALQLAARRYHPALFWSVILTTSTAGTTMSDYLDRTAELGYATGSGLLVVLLVAILAIWKRVEGTLSVDEVSSRRREAFYWTAILVSNTLGTALGDFLADDSGLGFLGGAIVVGSILAVVLVLALATRVSRVLLFWVAFVATRPFGATLGDVLTKSREAGGLDFGTAGSSAVLGGILVLLVLRETFVLRRERLREDHA
jgi:uncharacterized membrane-anchored protein